MNSLVDANYTDSEEENEASPHSGEKKFQDRLAEDPEANRSPNSVDSKKLKPWVCQIDTFKSFATSFIRVAGRSR